MFFGPVRKDDARHNVKPSGLNMRPLLDFKSLTPSDALAVSAIIGETKRMATFHEAHASAAGEGEINAIGYILQYLPRP